MNRTRSAATVTLPSELSFLVSRHFNAAPEFVFAAWTQPEHVRRWFGGGADLSSCEIDLRVGGGWRYVLRAPDGTEHAFAGEYREIEPGRRLVGTERYVADPDSEHVVDTPFAADGDGTLVTIRAQFPSRQRRDGWVDAGMESGMHPGLDRLETIAVELARQCAAD